MVRLGSRRLRGRSRIGIDRVIWLALSLSQAKQRQVSLGVEMMRVVYSICFIGPFWGAENAFKSKLYFDFVGLESAWKGFRRVVHHAFNLIVLI